MISFLKRNILLIVAFGLPVVFIAGVVLSIYLPGVSTAYDFVYASCNKNYGYYDDICSQYLNNAHVVENGKMVNKPIDPAQDINHNKIPDANEFTARFFRHDTAKNESREITLGETQMLNFNQLLTSPDGVTISNHSSYNSGFFPLLDGRSSYGRSLVKGRRSTRLNLINGVDRYYGPSDFHFIGWVLPGRNDY